jgi:dipeptidyl aminopeptidase/acylaminoacyl peptidase
VVLADTVARGGTSGPDGTILFTPTYVSGLQRVAASGGRAVSVTKLDSAHEETTHRWPRFLPNGKQFLYYTQGPNPQTYGVYLGSLDRPTSERARLAESQAAGLYAPPQSGHPGYLLWIRDNTMIAQPFDPARAAVYGEASAVPRAETVSFNSGTNAAFASGSNQGAIVFRAGDDRDQLTWFSREGKPEDGTLGKPGLHMGLCISPDGKSVAIAVRASSGLADIWRMDLARGAQNRLTFDGRGQTAAWSPDGQRIEYGAVAQNLYETSARGVGPADTILQAQHNVYVADWSPDGRYLLYQEQSPETQGDLWVLPASGDRKPIPYLRTPSNDANPQFWPDKMGCLHVE